MLFKRYAEVLMRLEELGPRMGVLSNRGRQELQSLLEEQAWLSATLVKQAKAMLEDIDQSVEHLFDWMIKISDLIERASGPGGTIEEILGLEQAMVEAGKLREQLKNLTCQPGVASSSVAMVKLVKPPLKARFEAAPAELPLEEIEPPSPAPLVQVRPMPNKVRKKKVNTDLTRPKYPASIGGGCQRAVKSSMDSTNIQLGLNPPPNELTLSYHPPRELMTSLAEKLAPVKRYYHGQGEDL